MTNSPGIVKNNQNIILTQDDTFDLLGFLYLLRAKIVYILLLFIVGGGLFGIYTKFFIKPTYSATTKLYVVSASSDSLVNLADLQIGASLTADYEQLMLTRPILESVLYNLDLEDVYTYEELKKTITISNPVDTRILDITVNTTNAQHSTDIANELANQAVDKLGDLMGTVPPNIAEKAVYSDQKASPSMSKNIILGSLLTSMAYILILLVIFIFDNKIKSEEDIELCLGMPPIGVIPDMSKKK